MEIYVDILKAVSEGKHKPTHIMYRANLPWMRLRRCIDFLVSQGLLREEVNGDAYVYTLTTKGKDVLGYYKRVEGELCAMKKRLPSEVYL